MAGIRKTTLAWHTPGQIWQGLFGVVLVKIRCIALCHDLLVPFVAEKSPTCENIFLKPLIHAPFRLSSDPSGFLPASFPYRSCIIPASFLHRSCIVPASFLHRSLIIRANHSGFVPGQIGTHRDKSGQIGTAIFCTLAYLPQARTKLRFDSGLMMRDAGSSELLPDSLR